ncbi:MAG: cysteine hydrolase family protein [Defluviitaleaceae bacterium]|nr:cysteine hydrolase family protein [Defluviitaleaceae bacterium]
MKKLLIVVDYQIDFVTGSLGFAGAKTLETPILSKIKAYEAAGHDIIYTFDTHYDDYLETREGRGLPIAHCIKETEGHALHGKVFDQYKKAYDNQEEVFKDTFGSADLFNMLMARPQYDVIELVGVVSYICVLSNAVLAKTAQPEAEIVVDSSCTAGPDPNLHDTCLTLMRDALHIKVI